MATLPASASATVSIVAPHVRVRLIVPVISRAKPAGSVPLLHTPVPFAVPVGGIDESSLNVQPFAAPVKSTTRSSPIDAVLPSVRPAVSRSGRGTQNVTRPVPPTCAPSIDSEITPAGASAAGQSLPDSEDRLPYVSMTSAFEAVRPVAGAPSGPQLSPSDGQPARRLILERNSNGSVGDEGISKPIVLRDVAEYPLEPDACPASFEPECLAEHANLCLHGVGAEGGQLDVVGDEAVGGRHRVAVLVEERRELRVEAIAQRRVDGVADLLDDADLGRVRARADGAVPKPVVAVVAVLGDDRGVGRGDVVAAGDRDRVASAVGRVRFALGVHADDRAA